MSIPPPPGTPPFAQSAGLGGGFNDGSPTGTVLVSEGASGNW